MYQSVAFEEDYLGWASPAAYPLPTYLSLVRPLRPAVWCATAAALVGVGAVILAVARAESAARGECLEQGRRLDRNGFEGKFKTESFPAYLRTYVVS